MADPYSRIQDLARMIKQSQEVVVIRLKQRPPGFKSKLQEKMKARLGVPMSFVSFLTMMRRILFLRIFRIMKPKWIQKSRDKIQKIIKGEYKSVVCSN